MNVMGVGKWNEMVDRLRTSRPWVMVYSYSFNKKSSFLFAHPHVRVLQLEGIRFGEGAYELLDEGEGLTAQVRVAASDQ